jgi:hypothetical protein
MVFLNKKLLSLKEINTMKRYLIRILVDDEIMELVYGAFSPMDAITLVQYDYSEDVIVKYIAEII